MIAETLSLDFSISKNKRCHLKFTSEKRVGPVISVVIVIRSKTVETNTIVVKYE